MGSEGGTKRERERLKRERDCMGERKGGVSDKERVLEGGKVREV